MIGGVVFVVEWLVLVGRIWKVGHSCRRRCCLVEQAATVVFGVVDLQ